MKEELVENNIPLLCPKCNSPWQAVYDTSGKSVKVIYDCGARYLFAKFYDYQECLESCK